MKSYQREEQTPEWQCCHWSGRGIPAVRLETHSDREHRQDLFFIMMMRLAASLHMCLSFPPHVSARSSPDEFSGFPAGGVLEASPQAKGLFYLLKYLQRATLARVSKPAVTQPKALRSVFAWTVRSLPLSVPLSLPPPHLLLDRHFSLRLLISAGADLVCWLRFCSLIAFRSSAS